MPEDGLEQLKTFDAIFFGAVGAPDVPDHVSLWGLRLPICQGFDQYANVRPTRVLPGVDQPAGQARQDIDWVIVRENSEGEYAGLGRARAHAACPRRSPPRSRSSRAPASSASCASPSSWRSKRPRKLLTLVTKSNAQRHGMVMWDEIFCEVAKRLSRRDRPTGCWSTR